MSKEFIYTKSAPEPIGPYSQGIKSGNFIFSSGQIPIDPSTGQVVMGDVKIQTRRTLENIKAILNSTSSDLTKVVKVTLYLKNIEDFDAVNEVYAEYFGESKPARSTLEAARLPKDALIEIDVIAEA